MAVIARQPLACLSITDYESLMNFATMSNRNYVTEASHFGILGEMNAVRLIQPSYSLSIFTVVHKLEFCQKDHTASRLMKGKWKIWEFVEEYCWSNPSYNRQYGEFLAPSREPLEKPWHE